MCIRDRAKGAKEASEQAGKKVGKEFSKEASEQLSKHGDEVAKGAKEAAEQAGKKALRTLVKLLKRLNMASTSLKESMAVRNSCQTFSM